VAWPAALCPRKTAFWVGDRGRTGETFRCRPMGVLCRWARQGDRGFRRESPCRRVTPHPGRRLLVDSGKPPGSKIGFSSWRWAQNENSVEGRARSPGPPSKPPRMPNASRSARQLKQAETANLELNRRVQTQTADKLPVWQFGACPSDRRQRTRPTQVAKIPFEMASSRPVDGANWSRKI